MSITEDTITDWIAEYLRDHEIYADTQKTATLPHGRVRKPDLWIENDGTFLGEAEWKNSIPKGWSQAHDFFTCIESTGSFLLVYPDELKHTLSQTRLKRDRAQALKEFEFEVFFLRSEEGTDMRTVTLEELPSWLEENIYKKRKPEPDPELVIDTLQITVRHLTEEIGEVSEFPNLFRNVIGGKPEDEEVSSVVREAAAYLLVNQIAFYRVLSEERDDLPDLNPEKINKPAELEDYFSKVLEIDYSPVFAPKVGSEFSSRSINLIKETIKVIYGLMPEHINHDILGKVFHRLIPLSVRKRVAAYYTLNKAADLLSNLSIEESDATILDPACGSGTFLVTSYKRKKELLEANRTFNEEDHRRFLEKEITGIDIMPFASHLSTIQLALQAPLYETDEVRIGIEDSTKLSPSETLPSLSSVIPESERYRTLVDYDKEAETVEGGAISMDAMPGQEIELDSVDLVIMNPPFTRHQTVANFTPDYKKQLEKRLDLGRNVTDKRMKYCYWFVLLADKFLEKGGRLAAVLPVTFLRGYFARKLRKWFLKKYQLEYIVLREDAPNFSEDTAFREMLLIARKSKDTGSNLVSFLGIKDLQNVKAEHLKKARKKTKANEITENSLFRLRNKEQSSLDPENMFTEVALQDYSLKKIWEEINQSEKLTELSELTETISFHGESGNDFGNLYMDAPSLETLRRDKWILEDSTKKAIKVKHRGSKEGFKIKRALVKPALRRITDRETIDLSSLEEYVLYNTRDFCESGKFLNLAGIEDIKWKEWQNFVQKRLSHLNLATRLDVSAPGTRLMSYFSEEERMWSTASGTSLGGITEKEGKITSLWLNSTFNLLQILINRSETRGAYLQLIKSAIKKIKTIDLNKISEKQKEALLELFDQISKRPFPSVWKQLAMNADRNNLSKKEVKKLKNTFEGVENILGTEFEPRRKIDEAVAEILNIENKEEILDTLYNGLLREIATLKSMMK